MSDSSTLEQDDNKEVVSDIRCQYINNIEQALDKKSEVKLTDIAKMIKEQTGKNVRNYTIIDIVKKQMSGIELIKIGKADGIKRKDTSTELFPLNKL